ncbi:hypothetical protein IV71_GL000529 [Fructobacillus fructosus KCTC 3544]|nr:hypothetical protein IV71_GL000529 [Fructobacillus fructosus KCTC 3544]
MRSLSKQLDNVRYRTQVTRSAFRQLLSKQCIKQTNFCL